MIHAGRRNTLMNLIAPPANAVDAAGDWTVPEAALGVRLPADYKWLVETYGWGEFCDFLYLKTPFGTSGHNGVRWQAGHLTNVPARGRERDRLLVWGTTMDADRLCWLTAGEPDDWSVVVWSRDGEYEAFAVGAAEFIEGWAGGTIGSRLLVEMEPDLAPWFTACRPRLHRNLRLSEGRLTRAARLHALREALAPTADRGSWRSEHGDAGQDHFATVDTDWRLTYDLDRPHQIRVGFPPEDSARVRKRLFEAVRLMGCEVLRTTDAAGVALTAWDEATAGER